MKNRLWLFAAEVAEIALPILWLAMLGVVVLTLLNLAVSGLLRAA